VTKIKEQGAVIISILFLCGVGFTPWFRSKFKGCKSSEQTFWLWHTAMDSGKSHDSGVASETFLCKTEHY